MKAKPLSDLQSFSFRKLIGMAIRQRLVSDYRKTPRTVHLTFDGQEYELGPEEARLFLIRLLEREPGKATDQ